MSQASWISRRDGQLSQPMPPARLQDRREGQNPTLSQIALTCILGSLCFYFLHAATIGPSSISRREQVKQVVTDLTSLRDARQAELSRMTNLNRRLAPDFLDLDLLDERARSVLGYMRDDEFLLGELMP